MSGSQRLSEKSARVLGLIAAGYGYNQIVDGQPDISYLDIFAAADEALRLNESATDHRQRLAQIKTRYPKAYERWTPDEDAALTAMYRAGAPMVAMAGRFKRQPSAIRSRLTKLGLETGNLASPSDGPGRP